MRQVSDGVGCIDRGGMGLVVFADSLSCRLEYFPVNNEDDGHGYVESGAGGEDLVRNVLADHALLCDVDPVVSLLPAEERSQGQRQSHGPHHEDHLADPLAVAVVDVIDVGYGPVPAVAKAANSLAFRRYFN